MQTNPQAKTILVYGDSYVFGKDPGGNRYDAATRYVGVLQKELGAVYDVIAEGLRGRTLTGENGFFPHRNGLEQFDGIFGSHLPIDLLILALGTNDCNSRGKHAPSELVASYSEYLPKIAWWCDHLKFPLPKIMLLAPPRVDEERARSAYGDWFDGAGAKTALLPQLIGEFAQKHDLLFFDTSTLITVSPLDGIHLDAENNRILGEKLAGYIQENVA